MLVDELDRETGSAEKLEAHRVPLLHRAFSVFLYDDSGEETRILLQQRAFGKYHSGGLWANACCSHPRAGEPLETAVVRRLEEELGVTGCSPEEVGSFLYFHPFAEDLCEFEYDHVFVCRYAGEVRPDPEEIAQVEWVTEKRLREELKGPERGRFAFWFPIAASYVLSWLERS